MFVSSQERSYSCYIQSLLIWGGGGGSPGLVCNFPAWLMPPAHHRKAKERPDIYLWGCSKAWESRSSQACIYSPAAMRQATDQRDYFCTAQEHTHHIHILYTSSRLCVHARSKPFLYLLKSIEWISYFNQQQVRFEGKFPNEHYQNWQCEPHIEYYPIQSALQVPLLL